MNWDAVLFGTLREMAQQYARFDSNIKVGYVTAYDPERYAVRVRIEPESSANERAGLNQVVETNWIQIYRPYGGINWGYEAPPKADPSPPYGDQCLVLLADGGHGIALVGTYNKVEFPYTNRKIGDPEIGDPFEDPTTEAGEFNYLHSTGSFIKLRNDGTVMIFGKPQGLDGNYPGSPYIYLRGTDGTITIKDSENNRIELRAKVGTGNNAVRIEIQDHSGNYIKLGEDVGGAGVRHIEVKDSAGSSIFIGTSLANDARNIVVADKDGNVIYMRDAGAVDRMEIKDGAGNFIRLRGAQTGKIHIDDTEGNKIHTGGARILIESTGNVDVVSNGAASINLGLGGTMSGVVTVNWLNVVLAQINAALAARESGSSGDPGITALGSQIVFAAN